MDGLSPLDWVVLAAYGAVVVGIGVAVNLGERSSEDYLLGGRRMAWWAIGVSLIATSFSSAALIGGTGFGFTRGLGYLQLQLGDLLAIGVACLLFIPFYSRLRLTTAYEYLERRFGVTTRSVASALFIAQTLLRAGVLVYAPALALATVLGWPLHWCIVATGAAALLYSATGGLAAVVWTDMIQFAVVVVGVTYAIVVVAGDVDGGLPAVLDHASAAGRLHAVDPALDWTSVLNLPGALIAYFVLALSVAGTNQQAVQRYLSCRDAGAARRAALVGWTIGFVAVGLTLFLGACLAAWSELTPDGAALAGVGDQVLPVFIVERLPAGVRGLLVAAILAASMSSMDSAIHSMATAFLVDFGRRFGLVRSGDASDLRAARALTVGFGAVAICAALVAAAQDTQILETLFTWLGYFAGPLLGLFLLGVLTARPAEPAALLGVSLAAGGVLVAVLLDVPARVGVHPLWLAPAACAVTLALGTTAGALLPPAAPERTRGLTLAGRPGRPPSS